MSRYVGILAVLIVVLLAMGFAAGNAGHLVTLNLGILTLYRVPVTLVAFGGLMVGMLVMFSTGIYTDLKVRKILKERLAEESRKEQGWIDRNQQDLFSRTEEEKAQSPMDPPGAASAVSPESPRSGDPAEGSGEDSSPSTLRTGEMEEPQAPDREEPKTE